MSGITAKLYKSGNSYSLRIPMGVVNYLGLEAGEKVTITDLYPAKDTPNPTRTARPLTDGRPRGRLLHTKTFTSEGITLPLPLDTLRSELRRYGVAKASVFGSYARGEARDDSDLDLLVELEPGRTYLDLGGLQYALEQRAGCKVDIATRLNPHFAPYAAKDMMEIL